MLWIFQNVCIKMSHYSFWWRNASMHFIFLKDLRSNLRKLHHYTFSYFRFRILKIWKHKFLILRLRCVFLFEKNIPLHIDIFITQVLNIKNLFVICCLKYFLKMSSVIKLSQILHSVFEHLLFLPCYSTNFFVNDLFNLLLFSPS